MGIKTDFGDGVARWAWRRAIEWTDWPLCLSQPIAPLLLFVLPWPVTLIAFVVVDFAWRALVAPRWVSPSWADVGARIVALRFVCAPVAAVLLWRRGAEVESAIALLWPFVGPLAAKTILIAPLARLLPEATQAAAQPSPLQRRFVWAVMLASTKGSASDCEAQVLDALARRDAGLALSEPTADRTRALTEAVARRVGRPVIARAGRQMLVHPELARDLNSPENTAIREGLNEAAASVAAIGEPDARN